MSKPLLRHMLGRMFALVVKVAAVAACLANQSVLAQPESTTTLTLPSASIASTLSITLSAIARSSPPGGGGATLLSRGGTRASNASASGGSSGTMSFWNGSTLLGSVAAPAAYEYDNGVWASASLNLSSGTFAPGTYSLKASYSGSADLAASESEIKVLVVTGGSVSLPPAPSSPVPVTDYEYDALGNPTKVTTAKNAPGFGFATSSTYDRLSRRTATVDAKLGITQFAYNGQGQLTAVTDPRVLMTQSPRDGFGQAGQLISPDTGMAVHAYDTAGNLTSRTDSRGVLASHTYDALNRRTSTTLSKAGQPSQGFIWTYDETGGFFSNGIGRLTTATFPDGSASFAYDALGRPTQVRQILSPSTNVNPQAVVLYTSYGYDAAGNLSSLTYPSGRKLTLSYGGGLLSGLSLARDTISSAVPMITGAQHAPFGSPERWNWAMNSGTLAHERVFDSSGRVIRHPLGDLVRDVSYDAAGRITAYTHYVAATGATAPSYDQQFSYDQLDRLTKVVTAQTIWDYTYDANGNRTSVALNNGTPGGYTIASTSNRINAVAAPPITFSYDAAGNLTSDGSFTLSYDLAGRLSTLAHASQSTSSYSYDNAGQRVRKSSTVGVSATVIFVYDTSGHLLGEYDSTGKAIREYVWLLDTPVAVFMPDPALGAGAASGMPLLYYVHADHLDTPRVVVDRDKVLRWRWFSEPFGTTAPESGPMGQAAFTFNLRFPGQYYDAESGLHYNMQRDYAPGIGRYTQSDPIGLAGGINTYAYVNSAPTMYTDPEGLAPNVKKASCTKLDLEQCDRKCGSRAKVEACYVQNVPRIKRYDPVTGQKDVEIERKVNCACKDEDQCAPERSWFDRFRDAMVPPRVYDPASDRFVPASPNSPNMTPAPWWSTPPRVLPIP